MAATAIAARNFDYKSRNSTGKLVSGRLEASSEGAVVDKLRSMGLAPVEIRESTGGTGLAREISLGSFSKGVDLKALAVFSRQMATMVSAGLSLLKTLNILAEQTENKKLKSVLGAVTRDVESGASLSDALAKHSVEFPPIMVNMVRAGETGGFLEDALATIAENFEKESKLKATIKSAMTYPVMVLGIAVLAVIVMLIFIVPIFQKMFSSAGKDLPAPTMILVGLSQNMWWIVPAILVVTIGGSVWWRTNKNREEVRQRFDPIMLKLPVFGQLNGKIAIARFSRNLSNMIGAGVPILQALVIVGETSGNWVVENAAKKVADSVRQGKSIAGPLAEESVFPSMVVQMVAVGEDSGALETMLSKVADFYDMEVEATTKALTSLIEPLLIAFLGVVIGGMIVALYMPIFNMIQVVQQ
ncbi:type II secretion system F family protein [Schumannella luteola]|uniref:Type IV pilus assembly protein PilC n=1 Tax=Schumannella luteola TaxID=472059 RepID=A0A852YCH0_9MICO|nr:type II secretion system F family protein [Schumannella luteola]NYH00677.1 type IV pilus assembly protein PilC [Schumannella luteola]TPX04500.1 type II secretion system F family protein [Schumannella luteola]